MAGMSRRVHLRGVTSALTASRAPPVAIVRKRSADKRGMSAAAAQLSGLNSADTASLLPTASAIHVARASRGIRAPHASALKSPETSRRRPPVARAKKSAQVRRGIKATHLRGVKSRDSRSARSPDSRASPPTTLPSMRPKMRRGHITILNASRRPMTPAVTRATPFATAGDASIHPNRRDSTLPSQPPATSPHSPHASVLSRSGSISAPSQRTMGRIISRSQSPAMRACSASPARISSSGPMAALSSRPKPRAKASSPRSTSPITSRDRATTGDVVTHSYSPLSAFPSAMPAPIPQARHAPALASSGATSAPTHSASARARSISQSSRGPAGPIATRSPSPKPWKKDSSPSQLFHIHRPASAMPATIAPIPLASSATRRAIIAPRTSAKGLSRASSARPSTGRKATSRPPAPIRRSTGTAAVRAAKRSASEASRMAKRPAVAMPIWRISSGFFSTQSRKMPTTGMTPSSRALSSGSRTEPMVVDSAVIKPRRRATAFAVVDACCSYSSSIAPAKSDGSATRSKLSRSRSRLLRSGAMAPMLSSPKSCESAAPRRASGSSESAVITSVMAPRASTCMRSAISVASKPSPSMTLR